MNGNKGTIGGSVVALVGAAVGLAVAFGVNLSTAERDSIIAFVTAVIAVAPIVGAGFDHSHRQAAARQEAAATIAVGAAPVAAAVPPQPGTATAAPPAAAGKAGP